jgi:hypothetical protein
MGSTQMLTFWLVGYIHSDADKHSKA